MGNKKLRTSSKAEKLALEKKKGVENQVNSIQKLPTTIALLYEALVELDDKKSNGSTFKAIKKYISTKHGIEVTKLSPTCKQILKQEINLGNILQVGRKFLITRQKGKGSFVKARAEKQPENNLQVVNKVKNTASAKERKKNVKN